jgi:RNA-directed DNA polymerase
LGFPQSCYSGSGCRGDTQSTQENLFFCSGRRPKIHLRNRVIKSAVCDEAEKLIRRHQKYLSDLAANIRRKESRAGASIPKVMHFPEYWAADVGFNPYHVRSRADGIAYAIDKALASGKYRPRPAAKYSVPKHDGSSRSVSVFQIADNAVSNLTFNRLIEKNARHLSAHAYAYRRDLSVHDAVLHVVSDFHAKSRIFIAEFDFSKFFDSISHDHIRRILSDKRFFLTDRELKVIDAFLTAPSLESSQYSATTSLVRVRGIPQGTSISLFLANVAAYPLDRKLEALGVGFARYADDTLIWGDSYDCVCRAVNALEEAASEMGVEINFLKSDGISILCPPGAQAEFKSKSTVSFVGYDISSTVIGIRARKVKEAKAWMSYLIFVNLLQEPKRGKLLIERLAFGIDRDYLVMLNQIRRYLYGGLDESQLRKYMARQTPLIRYQGLMSFYPIVNDEPLLKSLDGWLLNSVFRALRLRGRLYRNAGITVLPSPHGLPKSALLTLSYRPQPGVFVDMRFPSIGRISRLIMRASRTYGASAVANVKSHTYYSS